MSSCEDLFNEFLSSLSSVSQNNKKDTFELVSGWYKNSFNGHEWNFCLHKDKKLPLRIGDEENIFDKVKENKLNFKVICLT
jgi:hypothetical protein